MNNNLQIVFEGFPPSDAVRARVQQEAEKLDQFFERIHGCRVVICESNKRKTHGNLFDVTVHLSMPDGRDIHINHNPSLDHAHEDVYVAIRDAFRAARRKLQDEARKMRGNIKQHDAGETGEITSLVAEKEYGFIRASDGREIYFDHRTVTGATFGDLKVGQRVAFVASNGSAEPQASHVRPV
ncbi:MAG: HPF/RaiA family ribosome-associated protein [Alphaproteobacteria bacterium]|nr:MAG: HPF/RaiA family ribosome-associated protein [Alphaproteobacteria bacterium]